MNLIQLVLSVCFGLILHAQIGSAIQCSICDTEVNGWDCMTKPPEPKSCPGYEYCINVAYYSTKGKIRSFTRSCSPLELPSACLPGVNKSTGETIQACYTTCDTNGCNADRSFHHLIDLLRRRRRK